ncbi:hypothetical protein A4H97_21635 [Niastella yeongjuensis]|uniref:RHS repeat-associated core domain-containing protein n=1 Tax=Niastella yeongjuensis TaxID=354355 RepID=A0A1V9F882_9BACT|nr:DUF6443 domain-containing protein [Niastella yeongjuensis]OQP54574.1 hypothetical protein A4H97_21635 [Niastella yeongjuensis]SEN99391.1 RHS repeat-associated core domain-containing protein [Niastella yeongjuensis]
MKCRKPFRQVCFISLILLSFANSAFSQFLLWNPSHAVGPVSGNTHYAYNQTPDQLVEIYIAGFPSVGQTYQWWSNTTPNDAGFTAIPGATQSSYTPGPLTQNMWFKRQTTNILGAYIFSNVVKLTVVSNNWEDRNYIREHDVQVTGVTTWQAVDQLPIGQKIQTTSYVDGIGRSVEKISRETATPATPGGLWGDVVLFSQYDQFGRESQKYLPYTTTTEAGKYKTAPLTEQPQYYTNTYNETAAYSTVTFDNSPLNRITNIKQPGTAWAAAAGNGAVYDMNTAADNVQKFSVDYVQGNPPVNGGPYDANTLYKQSFLDEKGKQVIVYTDNLGQQVCKKMQLEDVPSDAHAGWMCVYFVYDDKGLLRYQLQPEAVKYLDANGWSFAGANGQQVLNELCFQYNYDDKARMTWKKFPGVAPITFVYDNRDRVVFTQDGNQAAMSTPQWTANLYDDLDRSVITTLYNTTKTAADLQVDINNSVNNSTTVTTTALGASINTSTQNNPITNSDLNNSAVCTIVKYQFYDNYSFAGAQSFSTAFTNLSAYSSSDQNVLPILSSNRIIGKSTGSMTRVLGSNNFLTSTHYYDEKGAPIQTLKDNIKSGTDITTLQYHFDGHVMSVCSDHTTTGTGFSHYITLTKNNVDKLGRITSVQKQYGSNAFKTVASYDYDDVGRVKTNHLDPDYVPVNGRTGGGLESLEFNYNIHNQLTGINKDFALKNPANYNKWEHFFGMYLGFDNRDNVFAGSQLDGKVSGVLWNTQGDDAQRKYDFTYDNADRLVNAAFTEQKYPGDGWSNAKMDFTVTGTSGKITYDLNGNLLNMLQKGVMPGTAAPITIDELNYSYASYSNKLQSVTDQMTATNVNGLSGDFKDGSNGAAPDYVYDNNGNVVVDLNKNAKDLENVVGANGVSYNYLDKPEKIRIAGKGTIKLVYNADGEKLQRIFTPESGTAITTTYIGQFQYQATGSGADVLQYINFEEGRIRAMQPTNTSQDGGLDAMEVNGNIGLPDGRMGVYDYFVKDYQQNVRMVLTEETHNAYNTCTMESNRYLAEDPVFGQTGGANEVETTRYPKPSGWQNANLGSSVSRLGNNAGHNVGPNTLQKVMAGDQVSASAQYYYEVAASGVNTNMVSTVLTSLAQAITGGGAATSMVKANATGITNQLNGTSGFINAVQPSGGGGTNPQAYLTILFFDERFNFIEAADGGVVQQQVGASGSDPAPIGLGAVKAPKNGYAFVYVSNQNDQDVYFDNLKVGITRGNIIEESHYYAYGLKIAAISSRKAGDVNEGKLKNNYLYNEKEFFDDGDLNWYDYGFRNYDPQIGRFMAVDPLADDYTVFSPYHYAGDDPITNIDVNGLSVGGLVAEAAGDVFVGSKTIDQAAVFVTAVRAVKTVDAGLNLTGLALTVTSVVVQTSVNVCNIVTGKIGTIQVGQGPQGTENPALLLGSPASGPLPPIFWSEFWYPAIEEIDIEYSQTAAGKTQLLQLPEFPGIDFLMFHYEKNQAQQDKNGRAARDANSDVSNPNSKIFDLHEVAYKSTKEGGQFAIMRPAPRSQNTGHGASLRWFYADNNMQDGDLFLVPLFKPDALQRVPILMPESKNQPKLTPIPVPVIRNEPIREVGKRVGQGVTAGVVIYGIYRVVKWGTVFFTEGATLPWALSPL